MIEQTQQSFELTKAQTFGIALLIFLSFFAFLGAAPLFDLDEGAFCEATREMLLNDNYLSTTLNGAPRYDKPILIYWFQALSVSIFGATEWTYRLPSAVFSLIWIVVFGRFMMRHFGKQLAIYGVVIMASCLHISFIGKAAIADALLNMWLAMAGLWTWEYHKNPSQKQLNLVFLVIAMGFLTKGPVSILVPLATNFLFCLKQKQLKTFWAMTFNKTGLLIFFGVASPWYIAVIIDQGQAFIDGFFMKHNVGRFKSPMEGHHGSLFYYLPVALVGLAPFSTLFIKWVVKPKSWFQSPLHTWLSIWVIFVFVFFSLSGTKLPHYVIYGYTPLMILMATTLQKDDQPSKAWFIPGLILYLLLGLLPDIAGLLLPTIKHEWTRVVVAEGLDEFHWSYRLFFYILIALHIYAIKNPPKHALNTMLAMGLCATLALNAFTIPTYGQIGQRPIKAAAHFAKSKDLDVVLWGMSNHPSFVLYAEKLAPKRNPLPGEVVLTKKVRLEQRASNWDILFEDNGVVLARVHALKPKS